MRRRRTEITIETRRLMVIRTSVSKSDLISCSYCGGNVSTIPETSVLALLGLKAGDVNRLTLSGEIHRANDSNLCADSLSKYFAKNQENGDADQYSNGKLIQLSYLGET